MFIKGITSSDPRTPSLDRKASPVRGCPGVPVLLYPGSLFLFLNDLLINKQSVGLYYRTGQRHKTPVLCCKTGQKDRIISRTIQFHYFWLIKWPSTLERIQNLAKILKLSQEIWLRKHYIFSLLLNSFYLYLILWRD